LFPVFGKVGRQNSPLRYYRLIRFSRCPRSQALFNRHCTAIPIKTPTLAQTTYHPVALYLSGPGDSGSVSPRTTQHTSTRPGTCLSACCPTSSRTRKHCRVGNGQCAPRPSGDERRATRGRMEAVRRRQGRSEGQAREEEIGHHWKRRDSCRGLRVLRGSLCELLAPSLSSRSCNFPRLSHTGQHTYTSISA